MSNIGTFSLSPEHRSAFEKTVDEWSKQGKVQRLWNRDASLWTNTSESQWLDWLEVAVWLLEDGPSSVGWVQQDVRARGFSDVVLLGMGGSSLCPEVMAKSFASVEGFPHLHVLDSTDPAQVLSIERRIDLAKTLFIVASKSGSTLEPNIFKQYFYERTGRNGSQFWAITDPGSKMEQVAKDEKFARIFYGFPEIGGRYSALSDFGMVPAAAMGLDVWQLLGKACSMMDDCSQESGIENPGLQLGAFLGSLARAGRNKLTIICSPGIHDLGAWMEQLIAESTGKEGRGIIPVDREPFGPPEVYGPDRVFAYARLDGGADVAQDTVVAAFEAAGHPVVRIPIADSYQLGAEFFRWEMATAIAGSILGINPFDQPDVEASKIETRKLTTAFEQNGALPAENPLFEERGIKVFGDSPEISLATCLKRHLSNIDASGYVALLAYINMTDANEAVLTSMRELIRDRTKAATCLGFGPRFLHSTGQAYKGGPPGGVFIQITCEDAEDIPVPEQKYTFGIVKAAQAQGDLAVLRERGRRWLRVHLGKDVGMGLAELASALKAALQ